MNPNKHCFCFCNLEGINQPLLKMKHHYIIEELTRNKSVFQSLLQNTSPEVYKWKQSDDKWSLLEMLCHLVDEEREDFRVRVHHVLSTPDNPASQIDPTGWVTSRKYSEQDFNTVLQTLIKERSESIEWLKTLSDPSWDNTYHHPQLGGLTAKMFFTNWLAHDYLHIRQIIKLKYDYLSRSYDENLSYAGNW